MALALRSPGGGGGGAVVTTRPAPDPPTRGELARRRAAGTLPCPARLVLRPVDPPPLSPPPLAAALGGEAQRAERKRQANERDRARQARYGGVLRNHHVPYVPFVTTAERLCDGSAAMTRQELEESCMRRRGMGRDGDYIMGGGFDPNSSQYKHYDRAINGAHVYSPVILDLERMYGADIAPSFDSPLMTSNYYLMNTPSEHGI